MAKFNGHKNWNHWNVSLWINNDEGLYRTAQQAIRETNGREQAAKRFLYFMHILSPDPKNSRRRALQRERDSRGPARDGIGSVKGAQLEMLT